MSSGASRRKSQAEVRQAQVSYCVGKLAVFFFVFFFFFFFGFGHISPVPLLLFSRFSSNFFFLHRFYNLVKISATCFTVQSYRHVGIPPCLSSSFYLYSFVLNFLLLSI
ncbi:hypothetical protein F4774DRAFT_394217, partial [Daldinia eschscholtzii]